MHPTIAQLAERETVEAKQLSLGHWFESGWSETFLFLDTIAISKFVQMIADLFDFAPLNLKIVGSGR